MGVHVLEESEGDTMPFWSERDMASACSRVAFSSGSGYT